MKWRRLILPILFCCWSICWLNAQLSISGVRFTAAEAPAGQRMQVWLLSESSPAVDLKIKANRGESLMRYERSIQDAVPVVEANYDGFVWHVRNPKLGCGYYVQPTSGLPTAYYWLIDYTSVPFPESPLEAVVDPEMPCERVLLKAKTPFREFFCYTPQGDLVVVPRLYKVTYQTQEYNSDKFSYELQRQTQLVRPSRDGGILTFLAPLDDTEFTLEGDRFSEALGYSNSLRSPRFSGQRVEVHGYYKLEGQSSASEGLADGQLPRSLSAPAQVTLKAIGNRPVASLFQWTIVRGDGANTENREIVFQFSGAESNYTFSEAGTYTIELVATARNGACSASAERVTTTVQTSRLEVPNAFSPNASPGINDIFRVVHTSLVEFDARIYNEWGNELYHWTDPNGGWDGTYGGKFVEGGVYYYVISARGSDGKVYNERGHLNILQSDLQAGVPGFSN